MCSTKQRYTSTLLLWCLVAGFLSVHQYQNWDNEYHISTSVDLLVMCCCFSCAYRHKNLFTCQIQIQNLITVFYCVWICGHGCSCCYWVHPQNIFSNMYIKLTLSLLKMAKSNLINWAFTLLKPNIRLSTELLLNKLLIQKAQSQIC